MSGELFESGEIYVLRERIDGRRRGGSFYAMLLTGKLIGPYGGQEVWVAALNKRGNALMIFHLDSWGYSFTVRRLHRGSFAVKLTQTYQAITRGTLRRLCLDGTMSGEWRSEELRRQYGAG